MYLEADWNKVKLLYSDGYSNAAIARALSMNRSTVRRLLAMEEAPTYRRRREISDDELRPFARALLALAEQPRKECDHQPMAR